MKTLFEKIYQGNHLSTSEMSQLAALIFEGKLTEGQLSALLVALKIKGATADEMAGMAQVMQQKAMKIQKAPLDAMDNCGTGGDHSDSFNVSTTSAFVLAAGGITMAKHGNRSISSRSGSADVLECLGIDLAVSPETISYLLNNVGIAFLFAPVMHPSMKHVMKVRRELATPTIFNLIGPLTNPVNLKNQLMGTYDGTLLKDTAATLGKLGRQKAVVVHGAYGMDEANLAGETKCAVYQQGEVSEFSFNPSEAGLESAPLASIKGGSVQQNAEILRAVLQNRPSAHLDTVLLNAGLGFYASGKVDSIKDGVDFARQVVSSGAAYDKLQQLITLQKGVA